METFKTALLAALVLAVVGLGYLFFSQDRVIVYNDESGEAVGAIPGPDVFEHMFFNGNFTVGGGLRATSTDDTSATLTAADFDMETSINFNPSVPSITATFPASSTLVNFLPKAGQVRDLLFCNATTTAGTGVTLAFGTGMDSHLATSTLVVDTGDCAFLVFRRQADTDFDVFYSLGH